MIFPKSRTFCNYQTCNYRTPLVRPLVTHKTVPFKCVTGQLHTQNLKLQGNLQTLLTCLSKSRHSYSWPFE